MTYGLNALFSKKRAFANVGPYVPQNNPVSRANTIGIDFMAAVSHSGIQNGSHARRRTVAATHSGVNFTRTIIAIHKTIAGPLAMIAPFAQNFPSLTPPGSPA